MAQYNEVNWVGIKPTVKTAQDSGKQVTISTSSTVILAANDDRTSFALVVRGSVNVHIKLGSGATTAQPELEPGEGLSSDDYTGDIYGIVAAGSGRVDVFEV